MKFRQINLKERQKLYLQKLKSNPFLMQKDEYLQISDNMIENCIGFIPIPLGVCQNLKVNGKNYEFVPLATEEPSIIAGLNKACKLVGNVNSYTSDEFLSTGSIYIQNPDFDYQTKLELNEKGIKERFDLILKNMKKRCGGYRYFKTKKFDDILSVQFYFDMCDSMGANLINTSLEFIKNDIVKIVGGMFVMCILSNDYSLKLVSSEFYIPVKKIGLEYAKKILLAQKIAFLDSQRSVTHNKGILNGLEAFGLALGQDTRAISSSVMHYAKGKPLSQYSIKEDNLIGKITLPSAFAFKSKVINYHTFFKANMEVLNIKSIKELSNIASSIGLLQNFSAMYALVSTGIQSGHMKLQNKKD